MKLTGVADNAGGVKYFLSVLLRALGRARHFALVEAFAFASACAFALPTKARSSDFVVCNLLKRGGSVCESNTPATSKMPPAGFEDRHDHRTACASVFRLEPKPHYFRCATSRK